MQVPYAHSCISSLPSRWDLRRDTQFNTFVKSASWNSDDSRWVISTDGKETFVSKYLLLHTGFAAKRHIPDWKGIATFKGTFLHPSYWPAQDPELKGKKIALVGTGATGVQIAQELAPIAGELVIFQRTPNTSLPMGQFDYANGQQAFPKDRYPDFFRGRAGSFGGFDFNMLDRGTFDDGPEARRRVYDRLWQEGDFKFWLANYNDMLFEKTANDEAYRFWRDKTRARIRDPRVRDLLAPEESPYAFGLKRIPLENGYFDIFDRCNVHLVDVNATPIEEITKSGIRTSEKEWNFDFIVSATGFDALTGGLTQIDIRGPSGESLKEHWKDGAHTYLGMAAAGFPNMFFAYGPQAPTPFCNGPTCAQIQGDWIAGAMKYMTAKGLEVIEADQRSEKAWRQTVLDLANSTLLPTTKSVSLFKWAYLQSPEIRCGSPANHTSGIWETTYLESLASHISILEEYLITTKLFVSAQTMTLQVSNCLQKAWPSILNG